MEGPAKMLRKYPGVWVFKKSAPFKSALSSGVLSVNFEVSRRRGALYFRNTKLICHHRYCMPFCCYCKVGETQSSPFPRRVITKITRELRRRQQRQYRTRDQNPVCMFTYKLSSRKCLISASLLYSSSQFAARSSVVCFCFVYYSFRWKIISHFNRKGTNNAWLLQFF